MKEYFCNCTCIIDKQEYQIYQSLDNNYNECLKIDYKNTLHENGYVNCEFYDKISNQLVQKIPLQFSTNIPTKSLLVGKTNIHFKSNGEQ